MEVKFYKKCRLGTALDISRKEVAVQRDSAKYRISVENFRNSSKHRLVGNTKQNERYP